MIREEFWDADVGANSRLKAASSVPVSAGRHGNVTRPPGYEVVSLSTGGCLTGQKEELFAKRLTPHKVTESHLSRRGLKDEVSSKDEC